MTLGSVLPCEQGWPWCRRQEELDGGHSHEMRSCLRAAKAQQSQKTATHVPFSAQLHSCLGFPGGSVVLHPDLMTLINKRLPWPFLPH